MLLAVLGKLIGGILGMLTAVYIILPTIGLYDTYIPSANNRPCNGKGIFSAATMSCQCFPQWSGRACEYTACPGYNPLTGNVCSGRGECSPLLKASSIPDVCKSDWSRDTCQKYLQTVDPTLITCVCTGGFGGTACDLRDCPISASGEECSGNGNLSVSLLRNNSIQGTGCQCSTPFGFTQLKSLVSASQIRSLPTLASFKTGLCAIPEIGPDGQLRLLRGNHVCYCDALHSGEVCEIGACPDVNGIICNGMGHPMLGDGFEENITLSEPIPSNCFPVCADPYVSDGSKCTVKAGLTLECPRERPYRCSSGDCVSGTDVFCAANYEIGLHSRPGELSGTCLSDPNSCGVGAVVNPELGYLKSHFTLSSRLVYWRIDVVSAAQFPVDVYIRTRERLRIERLSGPGLFNGIIPDLTLADWELNAFVQSRSLEVLVVAETEILLFPSNLAFPIGTFIRVGRESVAQVTSLEYTTDITSSTGLFLAYVTLNRVYISNTGSLVDFGLCQNDITSCVWVGDDLQSPQGQYLCQSGLSNYFLSPSPCPVTWSRVTEIELSNRASLRVPLDSSLIGTRESREIETLDTNYTVKTVITFLHDGASVSDLLVNLTSLQFLTLESDIQKACICPPTDDDLGNQTDQNFYIFNTRSELPSVAGEYGVFKYVLYGDLITTRGVLISVNPPRFRDDTTGLDLSFTDSRLLSSREFRAGRKQCTFNSARSVAGNCSSVSLLEISDGLLQCTCLARSSLCSCLTEFGKTVYRTFPLDLQNYTCQYVPNIEGIEPRLVSENSSAIIYQTTQFPFSLTGQDLQVYVTSELTQAWRRLATESVLEQTRVLEYVGGHTLYYLFTFTSFSQVRWVDYGFRVSEAKVASASSNSHLLPNVEWNSDTYWESGPELDPWIRFSYNRSTFVSGIVVEFESLGVYIEDSLILEVSAQILVKLEGDSRWTLVRMVSDKIHEGSTVSMVTVQYWVDAIEVRSAYQFRIRQLQAFTNQFCNSPHIRVIPGSLERQRNNLWDLETPLDTQCICRNNCTVNGLDLSGDGFCNDLAYVTWDMPSPEPTTLVTLAFEFPAGTEIISSNETVKEWLLTTSNNYSETVIRNGTLFLQVLDPPELKLLTWLRQSQIHNLYECNQTLGSLTLQFLCENITVPTDYSPAIRASTCGTGYDCEDCGSSWRLPRRDPRASCIPRRALNDSYFYISELLETIQVADVEIALNFTEKLSQIYVDCPWPTRCPDGTCQRYCPTPTLYNCHGNGCVRQTNLDKRYKCACKPGWGGTSCQIHECVPIDAVTGLTDPHAICTVNGPGGLKVKPPFRQALPEKRAYSSAQLEVINRRGRLQAGPLDVRMEYLQSDHAPYGEAVQRYYSENGKLVYTNCPFMVRDSFGILRQLEDLVLSRGDSYPYPVTEWRALPTPDGGTETITPSRITQYDDAPYRCPTGECVSRSTSCDPNAQMCHGRGVGMVDGTCECYPEWETFVFTDKESERARVPYDRFNPTRWGFTQELPLEMSLSIYRNQQCNARNCSTVDCFVPRGCFPGTESLGFTDKLHTCKSGINRGKCALDEVSCATGVGVQDALVCSGKGIPQRRDYRDEYYCVCGDSNLGAGVTPTELSHLTPNGFGGLACQHYDCEETQVVRYLKFDPVTGRSFVNSAGQPLPGIWRAGCGGPAGPSFDPSETDSASYQQWAACCPDGFESCQRVLCRIRSELGIGSDKSVCMAIEDCMGDGRSPEIYACNNHGRLLSDGTCRCEVTETYGYTYDFKYFSYKGCFKKVGCKVAEISGRMCNAKSTCAGDIDTWTDFPKLDYTEQQLPIVASLEQIAMTNKSLILRLLPELSERNRLVVQSYSELALRVLADIRSLASDVCIYPNDTREAPYAMAPFSEERAQSILPYGRVINHAAYLAVNSLGPLNDKITYLNCTDGADLTGGPRLIVFRSLASLKLVRLYQRGTGEIRLTYYNPTINFQETIVRQMTPSSCSWVEWVLEAVYIEFNYKLEVPFLYQNKCPASDTEPTCRDWLRSYCENVVSGVFREQPQNSILRGCGVLAKCCIPITSDVPPVRNITLTWSAGSAVSELSFFGYLVSEIPVMPPKFKAEISSYVGQETDCRDDLLMNKIFKARGTPFNVTVLGEYNLSQAYEKCEERAGVLISDNDEEKVGEACFTPACLTSGQEISTPESPTRDYFFSCKDYGCYTLLTPPNSWYYVTSTYDETGALWQSARATGQVSSTVWYLRFLQWRARGLISLHQYPGRQLTSNFVGLYGNPLAKSIKLVFPGCPFPWEGGKFGCRDMTLSRSPCPAYLRHCRAGLCSNDGSGLGNVYISNYLYLATSDFRNYDTRDCTTAVSGGVVNTNTNPFLLTTISELNTLIANIPNFDSGPYLENTAKYWTVEKTCKIIFFSDEYCGSDYSASQDPQNQFTSRKIAYREFIFTSVNYADFETLFPLSSFTFDQCTNGGGTSCSGFGTSLAGKNIRSFALQGDCLLGLSKSDNPTFASWAIFAEVQEGVGPAFWVLTVALYSQFSVNLETGYTGTTLIPAGCRMKLFGADHHQGLLPISDDIGYFQVRPKFNSDLVKHTIHSEANPTVGTDQYSMGYLTHPFMCTHHQIEIIARVVSIDYTPVIGGIQRNGYVNLASSPVVLLSRDNPIIVTGNLDVISHIYIGNNPYITPGSYRFCRSEFPGFTSCREAVVPRPGSEWRWTPLLYDNTFPTEILRMQRYTLPGSNPPRTLTTIWTNYNIANKPEFERLLTLETKEPRVFARHVSWLKASDYPGKFELDRCVKVIPVTVGGATKHEFSPSVCRRLTIPLICSREYYPYTSPSGLLCDVCGPLSRTNVIEPGVLPIEKFPLANATKFPFEHAVKDAYVSGDLDVLIATADDQETQYDFMMNYILRYSSRSIIVAFPRVRQWLIEQYSTRPVFTSPGELENPSSWVDFRFGTWFPYSCAKTINPSTGIARFRCATKLEQCAYSNALVPDMLVSDIPEIVTTGITPSLSDPRCGALVRPIDLIRTDYWGFTVNQQCTVLEATEEFVAIELIGPNITFENTGKRQYALPRRNITWETGINLFTQATCNSPCSVHIDVTTFEANYQSPPRRFTTLMEATLTAGELVTLQRENLVMGDTEFSQLRWVITCLEEENCIATLFPIVVTTNETLLQCQTPLSTYTWKELPTVVDSPAPIHQCNFENGGACDCSAASQYGGPSCEWPAAITIFGKQVCALYGAVSGVSFPDKYPVNEYGVYLDETRRVFSCKCTNPGISLYVRLRQISSEPFSVIRYDDIFGIAQYGAVEPSADINVPVAHGPTNYVRQVCASYSSIVPSFISGDELTSFLSYNPEPGILMDLGVVDSNTFRWLQRNMDLAPVNDTLPLVTVDSLGLAKYTNINNLLYLTPGATGNPLLTDGYTNASISSPNNFPVTLPDSDFLRSYRIEVVGDSSPVFTTVPSGKCTFESGITWACIEAASINILVTSAKEIRMFAYDQTTRFLT